MVTRAANWGPLEYHTPVSLTPSLSLPPLVASPTTYPSASTSQHALSLISSTGSSSLTLPTTQSSQSATPSSSYSSSPSTGQSTSQQSGSNYNYSATTSSSMSHQQPRQPPILNMAAAAATQDPSPYSAPPVTQSGYYGNQGGGSAASSATSAGGSGVFGYGNGMMLQAPQQSPMYTSGSPYSVSTFPGQHNMVPHRVHADVAGLSQHSLHEFHHGSGNAPMDGSLLHGFDGAGMLPMKPKRKQVKNACVNCQKACKRCDEARPCSRCYKYGLTATCQDSARKERKRGIKRGPYKRRATTGSTPNNPSSLLQHPSMMLGNVYGQGGMQSASPHLRSTVSGAGGFRAESNGSAASSLYEGSSGGFDGGHMMGGAQYTSSAPSSVQRLPTSLPSGGVGMYDSPSVYGRDSQHVAMQPPSGRPYGTTRGDYDRSGGNYSMQYSSLSNGNRYGAQMSVGSSGGMPGSAPPGAMGFAGCNNGSRGPGSSMAGSSGFSPAMSQQTQSFLNAQHHRIHSDGSMATVSNMSGTTPSTSLSPRTPMGINGDLGALASGGDNKAYLHHASSSTMSNLSGNTAGGFMSSQSTATTGVASGSSTPQPFPLHLPQAPRGRNGSGNNNSHHSNSSAHEDRSSRPASRQDGSMLFHDKQGALDMDGTASLSTRYQMPVPRSGSGENRPRSLLPKMESTPADIAAYGAAA